MITLEGNDIRIVKLEENGESEVITDKTLFKGTIVEARCESIPSYGVMSRYRKHYQKVTMMDYTAEKLPKGYLEKKAIERALSQLKDNPAYCLETGFQKCVDRVYEILKEEDVM